MFPMFFKLISKFRKPSSQPYQTRLETWHHAFVDSLLKRIDLRNSTVLEIGCGRGEIAREIVSRVPSIRIHGIDSDLCNMADTRSEEGDSITISVMDAQHLNFQDNHFDVCFSLNTFEHIGDIQQAYSEIFRVLKPGGHFLADFGPIWTSYRGHHFRHWEPEFYTLIQPWAHLYLSREALREMIKVKKGKFIAEEGLQYIFDSDYLNRIPLSDHERAVQQSGFLVCALDRRKVYEFIPVPTPEQLRSASAISGIPEHDLEIDSLQLWLRKPAVEQNGSQNPASQR